MRAAENNSFLGRLLLWQKLALVVAAMSVPAIVLSCFYYQQTSASVRQARSELEGARFIRALGALDSEMLTHRSREYTFLIGDKERRNEVIAQEGEVDKQIEATDSIAAELVDRLDVSQPWQALKAEWASVKSQGLQQSPEDNDAAHAALDEHLKRLIESISNRSLASVDPEASTRALFRIASSHAPQLMLYSSNMRRHAVRAASKGYLGGDDRMGVKIFRERQQEELQRLEAALALVSPAQRASITEVVDAAKTTAEAFYNTVQAKILSAANLEISGGAIYDAGVPTNRALKNVSLASYDALSAAVEQRLAHDSWYRLITGASALFALMMALGLAVLITRSMATPLLQAISVFGRISSGQYDSQVTAVGADEGNQVLRALESMQGKLRTQIETERAVAAENSRIRSALDKASSSVLLADAQHQIIYLNDKAQAAFTRGANLEALSAEPARERLRLDSLTGSEVEERALGNLTYRTVSSPVFADKGERIGTVMEWTDRTPEVAVEKEVQAMLSAVLNGELASRLVLEGKVGFFAAASRGINQLVDTMAQIVAQVKEASGEVYRASKEIASGNSNLQQRTEEQSASLEETASSMEEMTTTVRQNADNAGEANQLAIAARDQAEQGGAVVSRAVHAMTEINDSSRKIADIIGVIDEIAFQTNLLALNAAVEAARAGEQGRGFAVVATEVRTLAGRSATAAKEIKELIQDSVQKVEDGSLYVTRSGQTLEQIVASVKKVSDIVAEIAAASREQSAGIGQVNSAVLQMDELTQQNAALVEQATTASQATAHEAHALYELMGSYRLGDPGRPEQASHTSSVAAPASRNQPSAAAADSAHEQPAPRAAARPARSPSRAPGNARLAAAAVVEDSEWQEF